MSLIQPTTKSNGYQLIRIIYHLNFKTSTRYNQVQIKWDYGDQRQKEQELNY
jgi:hypothetical protein